MSTDKEISRQAQKDLGLIPIRNLKDASLKELNTVKLPQIYEFTNAKYIYVNQILSGIGGNVVERVTKRLTQIFEDGTTSMAQKMEMIDQEVLETYSYAAKNLEPYFALTAQDYTKWIATYYPEMAEAIPDEHVHKAVARIHSFTKQSFGGTDMFFDESINCTKDDFKTEEGRKQIAYRLFMLFTSFEIRRRLLIFDALKNNVNLLGIPKDNVSIFKLAHTPGDIIANMRGLFWATQKTESGFSAIEANFHRMLQDVGGLSAIVTSKTLKKIVNSFDPLVRNAVEGTIASSNAAVEGTTNHENGGKIRSYRAITSPMGSEMHDPMYDNLMRSVVLTCEFAAHYMHWYKTIPVENFTKLLMNIEIPSYETPTQLWQQIPQADFIEHMFEFMTVDGKINHELIQQMLDDATKNEFKKSKYTKIDCDQFPQSISPFARKKSIYEDFLDYVKKNGTRFTENPLLPVRGAIEFSNSFNKSKKKRETSSYKCCEVLGELENYPVDMFEAGYKTFINVVTASHSFQPFNNNIAEAETLIQTMIDGLIEKKVLGPQQQSPQQQQQQQQQIPQQRRQGQGQQQGEGEGEGEGKLHKELQDMFGSNQIFKRMKSILGDHFGHLIERSILIEYSIATNTFQETNKLDENDSYLIEEIIVALDRGGGLSPKLTTVSSELNAKINYIRLRELEGSLESLLAIVYALIPLEKKLLKKLCEKDVFIPIGGVVARQRGDVNEHMIGLAKQKIGEVNVQPSENFRIFAEVHKDVHIQSTVSMVMALYHKAAIAYQPFAAGVEYIGGAGHEFINENLFANDAIKTNVLKSDEFLKRMRKFLNTKELGKNCLIPISASPLFLAIREKPDTFDMRGQPRSVDFFNLSNPESPVFSRQHPYKPVISGLEFFWYCVYDRLSEKQKNIVDIDEDKVLPNYMTTTFADSLVMYQTSFAFIACHMNQRYMSNDGLRNNSNMNDNEYGYVETSSKTLLGPYYEGSKDVQCGAAPFPLEILTPITDMRS